MSSLPSLYLTHGGGPCFWMNFPDPIGAHGFDSLKKYLSSVLADLPRRPTAILLVSAHWETEVPTFATAANPGMLYDYYGFPEHTYRLSYPAPGAPELATLAAALLKDAGIESAVDSERGFDHAAFVPMMIIDPQARIPVLSMSLRHDLNAERHVEIGRALAPLRDEGVLIIGSGSSYHNLRGYFGGGGQASEEFDAWLCQTAVDRLAAERTARLIDWEKAPQARACHPREEHLLPLMVAVGAAEQGQGRLTFHDHIGANLFSCFAFG